MSAYWTHMEVYVKDASYLPRVKEILARWKYDPSDDSFILESDGTCEQINSVIDLLNLAGIPDSAIDAVAEDNEGNSMSLIADAGSDDERFVEETEFDRQLKFADTQTLVHELERRGLTIILRAGGNDNDD